jgi:hypothetical protein
MVKAGVSSIDVPRACPSGAHDVCSFDACSHVVPVMLEIACARVLPVRMQRTWLTALAVLLCIQVSCSSAHWQRTDAAAWRCRKILMPLGIKRSAELPRACPKGRMLCAPACMYASWLHEACRAACWRTRAAEGGGICMRAACVPLNQSNLRRVLACCGCAVVRAGAEQQGQRT